VLPPVQAGVNYLDIFGKINLSRRLSGEKCIAGEAVELILTVDSENISQLKAPELKLDKFRVYKPEVKSYGNISEIRYCLIPLEPGNIAIKTVFASFDTATGKYQLHNIEKTLEVLPSKNSVTSSLVETKKSETVETNSVAETVKIPSNRTEPLYIKTSKYCQKHIVLWKNSLWYYITGFVIMPLMALVIYLARRKKMAESANPEMQLKRSIVKYAVAVLSNSKKEQLSDYERENIISACANALGMEQSASASEISSKIDDEELKEWLRKTDEASFNYSAAKDIILTDNIRRKLLKLVKSSLVLLFMTLPALYGNEADKLFDSGKYVQAAEMYRSQLDEKHPSPELLYNLGTCYLHTGKLPAARAALLAAHKLAPRDEEIIENLNLVNRKLVQNEVNKTNTPRELFEYCRDYLRPDEHLAMAAIIFGIAMILLALNPSGWKKISGISGTAVAVFIFLMASQLYDSYAPYQAVTLPEYLELKQLPSNAPSETTATIPGGSDAQILQIRGDWMEISVNGKTGWVKSDTIALVTH
jgi:tetratricopeptide (TPR) repeat protein